MAISNSVSLQRNRSGFSLVELIIVVAIIGILTAITIVSYIGITEKAVVSSIQSDLTNASDQLKVYKAQNSSQYPADVNDCPNPDTGKICLQLSDGNVAYDYSVNNTAGHQAFGLSIKHGNTSYRITSSENPIPCPSGYIIVPGSSTYGTSDFCVMKYEAKNVGGVATSQETGYPWSSISQTSAISTSAAVCTGCHLITEAEWLTIAQNVLGVNANWSGDTVGTGCIFRGNVGVLDACGYDGANPEYGTGRSAKASLTLTNGEVIWDLAGNLWEWTSGQTTGGQPGVTGGGYSWREWTAVTNPGSLTPNPSPTATGISGASSWNDTNNDIGQIYSSADDASLRGFIRGGYWNGVGYGVMALAFGNTPDSTSAYLGFRVVR